ncbi:CbtB domain-containing protein [Mycolicibacterium thermoresistibile]
MTAPQNLTAGKSRAIDISAVSAVLWLSLTTFLALVVLYFVGLDQGATSVLGNNTHIHEFVHDARHLLGFPCH